MEHPHPDYLDIIREKIVDKDGLRRVMHAWRLKSRRIAFTNGCFDLLHIGHLQTFAAAADRCEVVVVGVNADESVRRLKGEGRPLVPGDERALMLAAMSRIDAVVVFRADTPIEIIEFLRPDLLVKGGDWRKEDVVGADLVEEAGGEVLIVPYVEGHSTSALAARLGSSGV